LAFGSALRASASGLRPHITCHIYRPNAFWFRPEAFSQWHIRPGPYGPYIFSSHVCMYVYVHQGGLLRKPPLKMCGPMYAPLANRRLAHSTWIRSPALSFAQCACLCMGLRPVAVCAYVRKVAYVPQCVGNLPLYSQWPAHICRISSVQLPICPVDLIHSLRNNREIGQFFPIFPNFSSFFANFLQKTPVFIHFSSFFFIFLHFLQHLKKPNLKKV